MVNFQQTPKPRNYLSRGEQRRLLWLVMGLGLVVLLMIEAGKPEHWPWFATLGESEADPPAESPTPSQETIDTRTRPPSSGNRIPGTFHSPAPPPEQAEEDATGRYFPGIKPQYLQWVRDDKLYRPEQENKAWFNLLAVLKNTEQAKLDKASTGRRTFAQLFKQSREYRGELVTIRGIVRRANPWEPMRENEQVVWRTYRVWLFPDDCPSSPMIVYCLELPEGFPTGMEIQQRAEITAFHFKRVVYNARDSFRRAPMLAARTLSWQKPPPPAVVQQPSHGLGTLFAVITVAALLSLAVTVYVYKQTRPARAAEPEDPPTFDVLQEAEYPSDAPQ